MTILRVFCVRSASPPGFGALGSSCKEPQLCDAHRFSAGQQDANSCLKEGKFKGRFERLYFHSWTLGLFACTAQGLWSDSLERSGNLMRCKKTDSLV